MHPESTTDNKTMGRTKKTTPKVTKTKAPHKTKEAIPDVEETPEDMTLSDDEATVVNNNAISGDEHESASESASESDMDNSDTDEADDIEGDTDVKSESKKAHKAQRRALSKGRKQRNKRAGKRSKKLRQIAKDAGYLSTSVGASSGKDALISLVSAHDVQRMLRYVPVGEAHSFDANELALRVELSKEKITPKALQQAQGRIDAKLRTIMNNCVKNIVYNKRLRVTPSVVTSELRGQGTESPFTCIVPPPGVIEEAMKANILQYDTNYVYQVESNTRGERHSHGVTHA